MDVGSKEPTVVPPNGDKIPGLEWVQHWCGIIVNSLLDLIPPGPRSQITIYKGYISTALDALPTGIRTRLPFLLVVLLFSPRLFVYVIFIFAGFLGGYVHGVPTMSSTEALARWRESRNIRMPTPLAAENSSSEPLWSVVPSANPRNPKDLQMIARPGSPAIEAAIKKLLDLFVRDYICQWFTPIDYSKTNEFPELVHDGVRSAVLTLGRFIKRHRAAEAFLTISHVFVEHMREYRAFEATSTTLPEYLQANPSSRFNRYSTTEKIRSRLRIIGRYLVEHVVPPSDRASPILVAFTTEITATSLLESVVEAIADPDKLNQYIVSGLKDLASTQAKQDAQNFEKGVGLSPNQTQKRTKRTDGETDEIFVKVVEANRLPILGQNGVYCAVYCGNVLHKTNKVASESNPIWTQGFKIDWNKNSARGVNGIVVEVYNVNNLKKDDLIGSVSIPYKKLVPNKYTKQWFPLESDNGKAPSNAAELQLEVMYISTAAADIASADDRDSSPTRKPRAAPYRFDDDDSVPTNTGTSSLKPAESLLGNIPLSSTDLDPESLTIKDIFTRNQALLEFMQFMDSRQGGPGLVQFYSMADNYRQFSTMDASIDSMRNDAESLLAVFFGPKAQYPLFLPGYPNLGVDLRNEIKAKPSPHVFSAVQNLVLEEMERNHFDAFKQSDAFKRYVKEVKSTVETVTHMKHESSQDDMHLVIPKPSNGSIATTESSNTSSKPYSISSNSNNKSALELAGFASSSPEMDSHIPKLNSDETASPSPSVDDDGSSVNEDGKDSSALLIEQLESAQASEGPDFLIAAVAGLREQLIVIDNILQKTPANESAKVSELTSTKISLQSQISQLVDMIDEASVLDGGLSARVNLQNIKINIYDSSDDREPGKLGSALAGKGNKFLYTIQIERRDGTAGWMISKTYSDFVTFEAVLLKTFPKIAKMPLPHRPRTSSRAAARRLSRDLETWCNIVVSDAAMCESAPLQSFFKPESVVKEPQKKIGADVRGSVLQTIKGALKVAVNASNALDSLLNDMEDDARGVPRRTPRNSKEVPSRLSTGDNDLSTQRSNSSTKLALIPESPTRSTTDGKGDVARGNVSERLAAVGSKHRTSALVAKNDDSNNMPPPLPIRPPERSTSSPVGSLYNSDSSSSPPKRYQESLPPSSPRRTKETTTEEDWAAIQANVGPAGLVPPPVPYRPDEVRKSEEGIRQRKSGDSVETPMRTSGSSGTLSTSPLASAQNPSQPRTRQRTIPPVITDDELELVLDSFFATLEEAFALSDPSQWIRQKGLHVVKQLLRRAYNATLTSYIQKNLSMYMSEESAVSYLDELRSYFWPNDIWWEQAPGAVTPIPQRTEVEIQDTKAAAKHLLVSGALPTGGIQQIVGRINTVAGITRLFNMLQIKELNRILMLELLDNLIKDIVYGTVE
ncbi:hypothetical protein SmJEL517_g05213 [Synchytrium microbalum]|uniref:PXA domain-containing protein n=1 Tax=Synchytrium microbalum TaxID=1806994 RepID=A0A507BWK3_9FUNG|nr:uncharacterized protein SmJEL517_g05213 [Synchytrium microbalum]TPX31491.1 hypothetical protein SmJEL517_g05213 [Synchytrium microbalum]